MLQIGQRWLLSRIREWSFVFYKQHLQCCVLVICHKHCVRAAVHLVATSWCKENTGHPWTHDDRLGHVLTARPHYVSRNVIVCGHKRHWLIDWCRSIKSVYSHLSAIGLLQTPYFMDLCLASLHHCAIQHYVDTSKHKVMHWYRNIRTSMRLNALIDFFFPSFRECMLGTLLLIQIYMLI